MISLAAISRRDREQGVRLYTGHVVINEIGYCFLADTLIVLLAMQLGASNTQLGYLASTVYITGIVILLVPSFFGGLRLISVYWVMWLLRGLCCLSYFLAGWLSFRHPGLALWVLLAGYTGFSLFRNFAWPMKQALEKVLIPPEEAGRVLSRISIVMNYGRLLAGVVAFGLIASGIMSGIGGLLLLSAIGIALNTASAFRLRGIRVRERIEGRGGYAIKALLAEARQGDCIAAGLLYCGMIAVIILSSFMVPLFRHLMGMPLSWIFIFSLLSTVAMIGAGNVVKIFSDRIGSRPLLVVGCGLLSLASLSLAVLPLQTPWTVLLAVGTVMMFVQGMLLLLVGRLVLRSTPTEHKVGFTSLLNFAAALIAIVVGLAAGRCADSQLFHMLHLPNNYSAGFILLSGLALLMTTYVVLFLKDEGAAALRDMPRLLLSPGNLKAFLLLDRLGEPQRDLLREKLIVIRVSYSASGLATEEIRRRLRNPLIDPRDDLLRSLFFFPRRELLDEIIAEASDRDSWWRETAIFALGAYPEPRTERALLDIYRNESYPYLKTIAAKSLARIGHTELLPELRQMLFERAGLNIKSVVNLVIAISLMDREGGALAELGRIVALRGSDKFRQHIYVILSRRIGWNPGLEHFFYLENLHPVEGWRELLAEVIDLPEFAAAQGQLDQWQGEGDWSAVGSWCSGMLSGFELNGHPARLAAGLSGLRCRDRLDAMAAVYFSYLAICGHRAGRNFFNWKNY